MEPQAFGAGRGGSAFDLIEFIKKPQVIARIVAWVRREKYWHSSRKTASFFR
jgi:hypothetical protein